MIVENPVMSAESHSETVNRYAFLHSSLPDPDDDIVDGNDASSILDGND